MASAPPVGKPSTAPIVPDSTHRRARILMLCGLLAILAIVGGIALSAMHRDSIDVVPRAITGTTVIATPLPDAPTPTPLANRLTPTAQPPPTAAPPTSAPPVVAAPAVQPAPVNNVPVAPRDGGKGKGKRKEGD